MTEYRMAPILGCLAVAGALAACDQIGTMINPGSDLVGTWGPIPTSGWDAGLPDCDPQRVIVFDNTSGNLVMRSSTGTMRASRVEATSTGWELYEAGNSNALVITRASQDAITMNLGLLGQREFFRCS